MESNLVSIVMPAYNAEGAIKSSINSVLAQTVKNFELLVCDDSSSDATVEIVKSFQDPRVKLITNSFNKGVAGARNSCLSESKGQYIAFLDSDDLWDPTKLETQLSFMQSQKVGFSYGSYFIFDDDLNVNGHFIPREKVSFSDICKTCDIGCLTVMIDRSMIPELSIINIAKEDYATWLTILKQHKLYAYKYPGSLAFYRKSEGSLSSNKFVELGRQFNVLRNVANLSFIEASFNLSYYIVNGLAKHYLLYKKNDELTRVEVPRF